MDLNLDYRLRLHAKPEHRPLYSWAINELDAQGQQIGHDQIPWGWTLRFTATSCALGNGIQIKSDYQPEETVSTPREVVQTQAIRVQLRPGTAQDDGDYRRTTTFSMFGTNRIIKSFDLFIYPLADPADQESCRAWGLPSYTAETDFRNETTDDCVTFYLYVKPETFARYATMVSDGSVDEIIFSAGLVYGFYAEWSPSISTTRVKVLTADKAHKIDLPPNLQSEPPRLGHVGDATLYINRRLVFGEQMLGAEPVEPPGAVESVSVAINAPTAMVAEPLTLKMLVSLKRTIQFAVALLALIFLTTLLR